MASDGANNMNIMKSQSQHKHYCKYLSKRQKIYKKKHMNIPMPFNHR